MRKEPLHITADNDFIRRLLKAGYSLDLEQDGHYDACSGLINIWCSPNDRPACWDGEVARGGLSHPREYVGAVGWDWRQEGFASRILTGGRRAR